MRACPECRRTYPEVVGADVQQCPFCGHETASSPGHAPSSRGDETAADPVGALTHALRLVARRYPSLLALWLPILLVEVLARVALAAYERANGLPSDPFLMTDAQRLSLLGVALPLFLASFTATLVGFVVVSARVLDLSEDEEGRVGRALRRLGGALALSLLLAVLLLAGAAFIVPFLVLLHLFLFAPAAFADGRSVREALEESRRFARDRKTYGFTALVGFALILLLLVGWGLSTLATGALTAAGVENDYALAFGAALPGALLAPLLAVLPASYWHLSHQTDAPDPATRAGETAVAQAAARASTTKCPGCGSLIRYEKTGAPVAVACPRCGRSGRVL